MSKTFCFLEQGGSVNESLTAEHRALFTTDFSDFYRLNWRHDGDPNAFITRKNTAFSEGRSLLYSRVPKHYDYYIFADDDISFSTTESGDIAAKIRDLLIECNPISGTIWDPSSWYLNLNAVDQAECIARRYVPIRLYDEQVMIYSRAFADLMFPTIYHGSDNAAIYAQWVCQQLFPLKQVCFTAVQGRNSSHREHGDRIAHMPQSLNKKMVIRLFNADVRSHIPKMDLYELLNKNFEYLHQAVDKVERHISLGDLNGIYDVNNRFYKCRKPLADKTSTVLAWLKLARVSDRQTWVNNWKLAPIYLLVALGLKGVSSYLMRKFNV